ncbi:T9SS type A sorting domain-containing protein [Chryseobacterium caseinilyticum]|uniref:T9SS type A sorting domain-containing protein n=1 Tax=Chryseobacterium caseinilyticum TaxID=2771428 RepID=A0ABR8Z7V9_9FLAO|nr:T9SS type A sorting domain-containing protein [Chryseobacterium caseinilyticum]MBD8081367.1 T9SS type A sorting domain-containing protein [Chryseobacterium caseinilyticum]
MKSILLKKRILTTAVFLLGITANAQGQWDNVGSNATVSAAGASWLNLLTTGAGNYYLSYYDTSVTKGSVQQFDGQSWSYVGGSPGVTTTTALYGCMAMDNSGSIYYSNQAGAGGMEIRKFSAGAWSMLPNAATAQINYQALAVSSSGDVFAHHSLSNGTVKRYKNGAWEQVGNTGFAGGSTYVKMVVGTDDFIYVAQIVSGLKVYKISVNANSTDTWTLVGGVNVSTAYSSDNSFIDLALDSNNIPYVSYVSATGDGRKLNVKKFDGTNWVQVGAANFSDSVVNNTSIALSSNGTVYTAASIWDSSNPNHAKNQVYALNPGATAWNKLGGTVISDGASTFNELAVDTNNKVVLAYVDNGVKVKRFDTALLSVKDVKKLNIEIYPNPVTDYIYVKGQGKILSAEVYNTAGQIIKPNFDSEKVDLSGLKTGSYVLKLKLNEGSEYTQKILKK